MSTVRDRLNMKALLRDFYPPSFILTTYASDGSLWSFASDGQPFEVTKETLPTQLPYDDYCALIKKVRANKSLFTSPVEDAAKGVAPVMLSPNLRGDLLRHVLAVADTEV